MKDRPSYSSGLLFEGRLATNSIYVSLFICSKASLRKKIPAFLEDPIIKLIVKKIKTEFFRSEIKFHTNPGPAHDVEDCETNNLAC